jgi:hypothetical protein
VAVYKTTPRRDSSLFPPRTNNISLSFTQPSVHQTLYQQSKPKDTTFEMSVKRNDQALEDWEMIDICDICDEEEFTNEWCELVPVSNHSAVSQDSPAVSKPRTVFENIAVSEESIVPGDVQCQACEALFINQQACMEHMKAASHWRYIYECQSCDLYFMYSEDARGMNLPPA